jgi:hypothetical protein
MMKNIMVRHMTFVLTKLLPCPGIVRQLFAQMKLGLLVSMLSFNLQVDQLSSTQSVFRVGHSK